MIKCTLIHCAYCAVIVILSQFLCLPSGLHAHWIPQVAPPKSPTFILPLPPHHRITSLYATSGATDAKKTKGAPPAKSTAKRPPTKMAAKRRMKRELEKKKEAVVNKAKITLEDEDFEQIKKESLERVTMTQSTSYLEKIEMDKHDAIARPYLSLFEPLEKITKDDLVGNDLPFGLVPPVRYELWKLCGKVCDPAHPVSSQSLTPKIFIDRLFGGREEIDRNHFNYSIDYNFKFLAPGYGDVFFMDKVRCWKGVAWLLWHDYIEGMEDLPNFVGPYPILREENEVPLTLAIHRVNSQVNRQGVHPALLDMFWNFFTSDKSVLKRELVHYKLNRIIDNLENLEPMEGISPDAFYYLFYDAAEKAIANFDVDVFVRQQLRFVDQKQLHQQLLSQNKALRIRHRILTQAYSQELKGLYKLPVPISYRRYERRRLAAYYRLKADNWLRQQRRKAFRQQQAQAAATAQGKSKSGTDAKASTLTGHEALKQRKSKQSTDYRRRHRILRRKRRRDEMKLESR